MIKTNVGPLAVERLSDERVDRENNQLSIAFLSEFGYLSVLCEKASSFQRTVVAILCQGRELIKPKTGRSL